MGTGSGERQREEIRNPNIEIRNNLEIPIRKAQLPGLQVSSSGFGFVSDFDIPIFGFLYLRVSPSPCPPILFTLLRKSSRSPALRQYTSWPGRIAPGDLASCE